MALTPMMQQYFRLKEQHKDSLLFFRLGDFYEMFFDDAKLISKELDLVLTTRDRNKPEEERTPMCGVPYHSAEGYIARLIAKGYKVAICEQTEDPATAKGIVDRDVVRVVTPGTVIDASMLEEGKNNFLASVWAQGDKAGLCVADVSTGQVSLSCYAGEDWQERVMGELSRRSPREVLLSPGAAVPKVMDFLRGQDWRMELAAETIFSISQEDLEEQFSQGISSVPQAMDFGFLAVGGLLTYLRQTQKSDLSHLQALRYDAGDDFMALDVTARRNLELCETLRSKEKRGSLLWVLDKTKTAMGSRLIRSWLERPLLSPTEISRRLEAVAALKEDLPKREDILSALREVTDLERLIGRIAYGNAGGRDLVALCQGLEKLPGLRALLAGIDSGLLGGLSAEMDDLPKLCGLISRGIVDEPPFSVREGGIIRDGYDTQVDELRGILKNSRGIVAGIETREKERTGIKSLKIGFNKVFGYYIEVSKSYYSQVPEVYIRKQTLANCERYITQELKDMEHTILSAQDRITALEFQLFCGVRESAAAEVLVIQKAAAAVAQVDALCSFAAVAAENNYCRPEVDVSDKLEIADGRHPVVEKVLKNALFVPNDTHMDNGANIAAIITGPNMAGKSTYMRQVALIVLMAQMGSFVPARSARIGIVDRVFTRIGASDDLAAGQSTFMVEMTEVAELLKYASGKSLIILDEIGRGTSTYDGMAIARAVLEWCADEKRLGAKTLFATHYHELTALEGILPGVSNFHIAAKKKADDIVFLRKILRGKADDSYGVEVAKLAGVPAGVVKRGRELLLELEAGGHLPMTATAERADSGQVSLLQMDEQAVLEKLRSTPVETLTPLEAMNLLYELKQKL